MLFRRAFSSTTSAIHKDTIYALSTGWGKSAIAVVRVSGPSALQSLEHLRALPKLAIKERHAYYKTLYTPDGEAIDQGLLLYFQKPRSFTGEDMMEFHIHGSNVTKQRLLRQLEQIPSYR
jgi:tRNA modification GTPase